MRAVGILRGAVLGEGVLGCLHTSPFGQVPHLGPAEGNSYPAKEKEVQPFSRPGSMSGRGRLFTQSLAPLEAPVPVIDTCSAVAFFLNWFDSAMLFGQLYFYPACQAAKGSP